MSLFKSGNPALSEKRFRDTVLSDIVVSNENAMTAIAQSAGYCQYSAWLPRLKC